MKSREEMVKGKENVSMSDDILKQILDELRQANQFNRKVSKVYSILMVVVLAVAIISPFAVHRLRSQQQNFQSPQVMENLSWHQVHSLVDQQEFKKALDTSRALVNKNPDYYYGYSYLGTIYLAMGDVKKSEENFAKAYNLFPDSENEKALKAVRKRIETRQ